MKKTIGGAASAIVLGLLGTSLTGAAAPAAPAGCSEKPTVVLVHGAWAGTSSWSGEVSRLQGKSYTARAVANPLRGLTSDAASVSGFLKSVHGPVVLVGHSYGGSVITNAAAGNANVKALVYVDAAAPAVGETTGELSGSGSALGADPATLFDKVGTDLYLKRPVFVHSFGPDLAPGQGDVLWASQRSAASAAFSTPSKAAAWESIPSWYVIGGADKIITPASQESMAHRAKATIRTVPGGSHLTLITHPDAVTDQILAAAEHVC
ncbi:MAG TPA: alpha/beta hydrolase [Dactylosporangium sp.]|jgi:pimeloyl-ACP methyl ester carboxylesterase|uniref:Alpha/beta hydrolase n=1 Tax=Dactylosporangium darangshiense TaxID=579108 RepID=A0ABP8DPJ3_9ACTN|nr:alpha/beta hydrolase [Dactylosporangium sp.]